MPHQRLSLCMIALLSSTTEAFVSTGPTKMSATTTTTTPPQIVLQMTETLMDEEVKEEVSAMDAPSSSIQQEENNKPSASASGNPMFEYLKFDGKPTFDVMQKTMDYTNCLDNGIPNDESIYADDYVLRGPVIGPIVRKDLAASQKGLGLAAAFPNLKQNSFGHTIDPENPYRCFYFQRWRAKHENDLDAFGDIYPASGTMAEMPVSVFTVVWNPEGKIIYEQVGAVVDRLEGNTAGKAAVFGLLHHAGLKIPASPGDKVFRFIQSVGHLMGGRGRSWSRKKDVPKWWVSPSRGADETEQW